MSNDTEKNGSWLINQHFIGDSFEDSLFNIDNQKRELACSWKIMSSMIYFSALANSTWRWKAIGIPLSLIDNSLQGDIDLLVAMIPPPVMQEGRRVFPPPVYRCFELKTAKVSRDGVVKSLKTGKFRKVKGQLEKLFDLGSQQVFLLEAFIVESGYSCRKISAMPEAVREAVTHKYEDIMGADYGYVTMAIEQIPGFSENATAVMWPTATIKPSETKELTGKIREIIDAIEAYAVAHNAKKYGTVITYCYACKELTYTQRTGPYFCSDCGTPFI